MTGVAATTLNGNALELPPPLGFVTCTVQLSGLFCVVISIVNCVLLTNVTADAGRVEEPPPADVTVTVGLFTKFAPLIVTVCGLVEPVTGFGLTPLIVGVTGPITVTFTPADCGPGPPVCESKPFCTTKL